MNRRSFLLATGAALSGRAFEDNGERASQHRLPVTDSHYERVKSYIEEVPVADYHWASSQAYDRFHDIKYGIRIHWGIYSIAGLKSESWPYLGMSFRQRQEYNQLYPSWNPTGFYANEWLDLFSESGLKMLAFTTKHHEGFSMFDTKTRVRSRANWVAAGGPATEPCDLAYSIMETPLRRDVTRELWQAAQSRGLKIALYFSHPDWYDTDFRPASTEPRAARFTTAGFTGSPGNIRRMHGGRARLRERRMPRRSSCCCKGKRTRLTQ